MSETCDYNVSHNTPCGEDATHRYWMPAKRWFYVCAVHAAKVYRDSRKKVDPTPLVKTLAEDSVLPAPFSPVIAAYKPAVPALPRGKSLSQLFREQQEAQSEGSDLA